MKGDKALIKKLKRLGDKRKMRRVLRAATNASAQEIVKAVRKLWPTDSGLSKKSVIKKILKTKSGYTAIIGIDKDAGVPGHIPSNIDHLIELGWQTKDGVSVPAIAPLRRGYDSAKAAAEAKFASKAKEAIEREARKP
jgi:hypothetical protein